MHSFIPIYHPPQRVYRHHPIIALIYHRTSSSYLLMQVQNNISLQAAHSSEYGISVGEMCSELSHFVIFDFSYAQQSRENLGRKPTVVTYRHPTITFNEVLQRYTRLCPSARSRKNIRFTLPRGYIIPMRHTVLELRKSLRRESVDGLVLFTFEGFEQDDEEQREGDFVNECGLMDYIGREDTFQKDKLFTFHFILPGTKFIISVQLAPTGPLKALYERLIKEVGSEFGVMLEREDIKQLRKNGKELQWKVGESIANQPGLYDQDTIEVVLAGKGHQFVKKSTQDNQITLVRQQQGKASRSLQLSYQDYKGMQVKNIYKQFFIEKGEIVNEHIPVCLRVMEFILKGGEALLRLDSAIQKLKQLGQAKLVGYFISEKMVFYKQVPSLLQGSQAKEFTLQQLEIPQDQVKERSRFDKLIKDRLGSIDMQYFRNKSHVEPIFIYTTNLQYLDKQSGEKKKIYESLNATLRSTQESVLLKTAKQIEESWVYRYTSTLLKHLKEVTVEKCKVYRGVNWDPEGRQGEFLTFKSFTSTSRNRPQALNFAICGKYLALDNKEKAKNNEKKNEGKGKREEGPQPPLVLFQMSILSGKSISKMSQFQKEQELLLQPFTQFLITKVEKQKVSGYDFTVYHMSQVQSPKDMPKATNNYILWVDNKPNEGREIFNKFIQEFTHPSVLFQINSTSHLQQWIQTRQDIINDKDSKIVMVTNMVRPEGNGQPNFYAGVDAINLIRLSLPDIPIAVYVRDTNASNKNLQEKQVPRKGLVVISQFEELAQFAEKHTTLKFRSLIPKEPPLHMTQPMQSHSPIQEKGPKSAIVSKGGKEEKGKCEIM